ncbi:putative adenylate-forming enzyme [Herbiconiux ginsengi]|uniref:Putative adenylate-forming enzyme n=2 Tax=Herbiconiux ginsengi TaxID=381665 RepID=A0A1H3TSA3_9MICO|nr:putative adenylate-forming enzyme [Herbiconiux ginsengi]
MTDRALVAVMLGRFVRARWGFRFRTRARFEAWQRRRIRSFLRRIPAAPFYRSDGSRMRLDQLPIVDKSTLLERFDELNTRGVRLVDALDVALEAERSRDFAPLVDGDLTVGLSSGTSGRRGAFLVSPRERMLWAGTILARVLDHRALGQLLRPWESPLRIAFFLRAGGNLYESVASSRIRFAFHDLTQPFDGHVAALDGAVARGVGPDVLVAPASVLDALARRALDGSLGIRPGLVVSVAEVLEPETAGRVKAAWGVSTRQVYQATEGLLGVSCADGALHLNEESVFVEREWLDAEHTHFAPVVTDFDRRTQIIARYRLDDVLRVDPAAPERCACGRVTAVLAAIDGRADAVLRLPGTDGLTVVEVFPDAVRRAMALNSDGYADWRIRQTGLDVRVSLADAAPDAPARVASVLRDLLSTYGCMASVVEEPWATPDPAAKVRRIVREDVS